MRLEFTIALDSGDGESDPEITFEPGSVRILHHFETSHPCFDFASNARVSAEVLELEVTATQRPELCAQVVSNWEYRVVLDEIPEDVTRLAIRHVAGSVRAEWDYELP